MSGKQHNKSDHKPKVIDAKKFIRDYNEKDGSSTSEGFRDLLETISTTSRGVLESLKMDDAQQTTELSGGDPDALPLEVDSGEETPGGSIPMPDQDIVEEIGVAAGVTYQDAEPLKVEEKLSGRDESRWELDPASSEDYQDRQIGEALDAGNSVKKPAKRVNRQRGPRAKPRDGKRS